MASRRPDLYRDGYGDHRRLPAGCVARTDYHGIAGATDGTAVPPWGGLAATCGDPGHGGRRPADWHPDHRPTARRITVWQPGRLLRWESILTPPPLKELNPFRDTDPPHLHGLYRSVDGQFALTALGPNLTRVTRSSSYQHGLYPAAYWRLWCDYVAHRGHVHILSALKRAAEQAAVAADTGASVTP